jgi:Calcineurin-like phosphoesterase
MSRRQGHPLRFRPDGGFVVVQLTDLHLGASVVADRRTRDVVEAVLRGVAADLVVLTGDILEGQRAAQPRSALRVGLAPILERGLPWAPILGNHDDEGRFSRERVFGFLRSLPGCLGSPGPASVSGVATTSCGSRGESAGPRSSCTSSILTPTPQRASGPTRGFERTRSGGTVDREPIAASRPWRSCTSRFRSGSKRGTKAGGGAATATRPRVARP